MKERRSTVLGSRRVGLSRYQSQGAPLTQVNGQSIRASASGKQQKVESASNMKEDPYSLDDPITAPPESSDNEAENISVKRTNLNETSDSDKEYGRRRTADIHSTNFKGASSPRASNLQSNDIKIRPPKKYVSNPHISKVSKPSSLAGSKRAAEEDRPREISQLLPPRDRKKKKPIQTYGSQVKINGSQPRPSGSKAAPMSSATLDEEEHTSARKPFRRPGSISPVKSETPRKPNFKSVQYDSDLDETDYSRPSAFKVPLHISSANSSPIKPGLRHISPVGGKGKAKSSDPVAKDPQKGLRANRKGRKASPDRKAQDEFSQRPVFKMPELDELGIFDNSGSQDASAILGESPDETWEQSDPEEITQTTIPRCPICHEEVDRELLEKHSTHGRMSVKKQTLFCILHKRDSALRLVTERGYPTIDWDKLESRCSKYQDLLQKILEGKQSSHYRNVLKEMVDSGKNRTLHKSNLKLSPGYYGPRGLLAMTQFIMRTLSPVIRKRAVEDRLISARSYTGYVQAVLVPELAVRLIMEDMSVTEDRARDILAESVEMGELIHEEAGDVVKITEEEESDEGFLTD